MALSVGQNKSATGLDMTFKNHLVIALIIAMGSFPSSASAEITLKRTYTYFNIDGKSAEDLDRALANSGPSLSSGSRHPGATEMEFGGSIKYTQSNGRCRISDARITLKLNIILPRWRQRAAATRDTAIVWDTLSRDIKRHEDRHGDIARQHAKKLEKSLEKLRPQRDCKAMEALADKTSERVLGDHDRAQDKFDRVETINFENRMIRLLEYRLQTLRDKP